MEFLPGRLLGNNMMNLGSYDLVSEILEELGVDINGYSLWGGSVGGRMTATISSYGVEPYGGSKGLPKPATAVIQYTGHTDYNKNGED